jgi:carboxymethylenebutenolidase
VLASFVGVVVVAALALLVWALVDLYTGASADANANTEFRGPSGRTLAGYLSSPSTETTTDRAGEAGLQSRPAVLLMHEWWGLTDEIRELADRLAAEGYVVLAPDAFRGQLAESVPGALFQSMLTPQEQLSADIDAAYRHLRSLPNVDRERIATVGFCFGGTQSFLLSTRVAGIRAVATFYGSGLPTESQAYGALDESTAVLGVFGRADSLIPLSQVRAFEQALEARRVPHAISIYDGVGHAFVTPDRLEREGPARDAWHELLRFLEKQLP